MNQSDYVEPTHALFINFYALTNWKLKVIHKLIIICEPFPPPPNADSPLVEIVFSGQWERGFSEQLSSTINQDLQDLPDLQDLQVRPRSLPGLSRLDAIPEETWCFMVLLCSYTGNQARAWESLMDDFILELSDFIFFFRILTFHNSHLVIVDKKFCSVF